MADKKYFKIEQLIGEDASNNPITEEVHLLIPYEDIENKPTIPEVVQYHQHGIVYAEDNKLTTNDYIHIEPNVVEGLPSGFVRLEYVENLSTNSIHTNVTLTNNDTISVIWQPSVTTGSQWRAVFANHGASSHTNLKFGLIQSTSDVDHHFWGSGYASDVTGGLYHHGNLLDYKWKTTLSKTGAVDENLSTGVTYNYAFNSAHQNATFSDTIDFFGVNSWGSSGRFSYIKIFGATVNNGITANFIPVREIATNKVGLYDLVEKVFYPNSSTLSDTLSGGPEAHLYDIKYADKYVALVEDIPTKVGQLINDKGYTSNVGTITGIKMNGTTVGTSGVVDLGTVVTGIQLNGTTVDIVNGIADLEVLEGVFAEKAVDLTDYPFDCDLTDDEMQMLFKYGTVTKWIEYPEFPNRVPEEVFEAQKPAILAMLLKNNGVIINGIVTQVTPLYTAISKGYVFNYFGWVTGTLFLEAAIQLYVNPDVENDNIACHVTLKGYPNGLWRNAVRAPYTTTLNGIPRYGDTEGNTLLESAWVIKDDGELKGPTPNSSNALTNTSRINIGDTVWLSANNGDGGGFYSKGNMFIRPFVGDLSTGAGSSAYGVQFTSTGFIRGSANYDVGSSLTPFTNIYGTTIYENGVKLSDKYTYTQGTGISIANNVVSNAGVRSVVVNGSTMTVNTNGTEANYTINAEAADTVDGQHIVNGYIYSTTVTAKFGHLTPYTGKALTDYKYQTEAALTGAGYTILTDPSDYIYLKLNLANKYYNSFVRFLIKPLYDNIAGSSEVDSYCRATNNFYINSVGYNGTKLIGICQPGPDTNTYYLKLKPLDACYQNENYGACTVYCNFNLASIDIIQQGDALYDTIKNASYVNIVGGGITSTGLWGTLTPAANATYDLGTNGRRWRNIYANTITENGENLSNKYVTVATTQTVTGAKTFKNDSGVAITNSSQSATARFKMNSDGSLEVVF